MSEAKISEAAIEAALTSMEVTKNHLELTPLDRIVLMLAAAMPHLHPQPAELNEVSGNSGELPPLPSVDGYDKRIQGHYSAEQMRDYARNAIRSTKQEQACSGLDIDKMAKELLERHTVAVPVAVEDGRCFMVREQDALDAIRAALAATGKQQVGDLPDDVVERCRTLPTDKLLNCALEVYARSCMYGTKGQHDAAMAYKDEIIRRITGCAAQVGEVHDCPNCLTATFSQCVQETIRQSKHNYVICYGGVPTCWHVKPEDMPAQKKDMGQFRPAVHAYLYLQHGLRSAAGIAEGKRLLALIEQSDATAGVE